MSTIRSELRARRGLSQKPKLLGAQRARGALTDMTNALAEEPAAPAPYDVCAPPSPPAARRPSEAATSSEVSLVSTGESFMEISFPARHARAGPRDADLQPPPGSLSGAWSLSGVMGSLLQREEAEAGSASPTSAVVRGAEALGHGLLGIGRGGVALAVAAAYGGGGVVAAATNTLTTTLDNLVEGGLGLVGLGGGGTFPATPRGRRAARAAASPASASPAAGRKARTPPRAAPAAPPAGWDADWSVTPPSKGAKSRLGPAAAATSPARRLPPLAPASPAARRAGGAAAAAAASAAATLAGGSPPPAPRHPAAAEAELAAQVQRQLQVLLAEKARLAQENARLTRENASLHELLTFQQDEEEDEEDADGDGEGGGDGGGTTLFSSPTPAAREAEEE